VREIRTEIEIDASAERVWTVLTDFSKFQQWNPFILTVNGTPTVGTRLKIHIRTSHGKIRIYSPTITKVDLNHELCWSGKSLIPGVFDGQRIFTIEILGTNRVQFVHKEIFSGFMVWFTTHRMEKDIRQSFEKMNYALKKRVEEGA